MSGAELELIALAVRTGIAPAAWLAEPPGYIEAALQMLYDAQDET